jgi:hypothetical protein
MQLNERQQVILMGILHDQKRLAGLPWGGEVGVSRDALGRHRLRIRYAREGLVPMNLADWIGHAPTNSECVLFHREYARLEDMGLIVRHNPYGGRRTSHLRLTEAGRVLAEHLLVEDLGTEGDTNGQAIDWSNVELMPIELPPGMGDRDGEHRDT